jgi:endonuclease/exonuclease/phosphatase family metal-dependent hydrolase
VATLVVALGAVVLPSAARSAHGEDGTTEGPVVRPRVVGVATMNVFKRLRERQLWRDAVRLTDRPDVDVVAWQEAERSDRVLARLARRGWETHRWARGARGLAVSWRADELTLVSAEQRLMHRGAGRDEARFPFPAKHASVVTLAVADTGQHLTVLNTHLNHKTENYDVRRGLPLRTRNARLARRHIGKLATMLPDLPGRYAVMAGDFNFDVRGDRRHRPEGFMADQLRGLAVSSFAALGLRGLPLTHPVTGRFIDYVYVRRADRRGGHVEFRTHRVLRGYRSDHRPVLARLRLA